LSSFGSSKFWRRDDPPEVRRKLFAQDPRVKGHARDITQVFSNDINDEMESRCERSSETQMCVDRFRPISVVIPGRARDQPSIDLSRENENSDLMILDDGSWTTLC